MRKLYAVVLPLLAIASLAISAGSAQAATPHWYKEGVRLPFTSAKTQDLTWGKLTLTASNGATVTCKVIDGGNVWNVVEATAGKDNLEAFTTYECTSTTCSPVSATVEELPYESELTEAVSGTIRDKITVKLFKLVCGASTVTFKGTLEPKVVNGTSKTAPSVLEFGTGSGKLESISPTGLTATVEGKDKIEGFEEQELLTAKKE